MKNCTKCKEKKELCEFRKRGDGLFSWCKKCESNANKKRYIPKISTLKLKVNKTKEEIRVAAKIRMLKHRYNITIEEYEEMYTNQNKKCAICKGDFVLGGTKGLFVDHNHDNMEVRGLLCRNCNSAIGLLNECKDILLEAIKYLKLT